MPRSLSRRITRRIRRERHGCIYRAALTGGRTPPSAWEEDEILFVTKGFVAPQWEAVTTESTRDQRTITYLLSVKCIVGPVFEHHVAGIERTVINTHTKEMNPLFRLSVFLQNNETWAVYLDTRVKPGDLSQEWTQSGTFTRAQGSWRFSNSDLQLIKRYKTQLSGLSQIWFAKVWQRKQTHPQLSSYFDWQVAKLVFFFFTHELRSP